jgi:hypothetical protein
MTKINDTLKPLNDGVVCYKAMEFGGFFCLFCFAFFFFLFFPFFPVVGTELRALHLPGKHSSTELNPQPQQWNL